MMKDLDKGGKRMDALGSKWSIFWLDSTTVDSSVGGTRNSRKHVRSHSSPLIVQQQVVYDIIRVLEHTYRILQYLVDKCSSVVTVLIVQPINSTSSVSGTSYRQVLLQCTSYR